MKLTLKSKHEEVPGVTTFSFVSEQDITWQAGQYMHYVLPHANMDDRGDERWFTISSAPFEKEIRITTRYNNERSSSFKDVLFTLPVGSTIESDGPEGEFTIDSEAPFVFIAGGIGITPYRSILLDLDTKGASITGTLLYANRDSDIVFKEELDTLAKKHSGLSIEYVINPMRIDGEYIRKAIPDLSVPIFYVSGPEPMVAALKKTLLDIGVMETHIKIDDFPGYESL